MSIAQQVLRPWYWFAGKVFGFWARPVVQPASPAELLAESDAPVCYVLETGGLADTLALERYCRLHGMPPATESIDYCGVTEARRIIVLKRMSGVFFRRRQIQGSQRLQRLIDASINAGGKELLLVPVGIYWGRSPKKEQGWWSLVFSEQWDIVGRTRKFFQTVFQGRNTLMRFSEPLPISAIVQRDLESEVAFRKVSRILRVHFRQRRTATLGPDLSHRRTLLNEVLNDPAVRAVINAEAGGDRTKLERTTQKARNQASEIAAHISYPTVRVVERFLGWVWNRIYDGLELQHIETLHEEAKNNEIVYVPCHRSHVDYLLLSYIVYHQGLSLPHVAAGVNLNIPFVGGILRRSGAFYLRRSFKGNRLYATVFNAYMRQILARGHAIEYFVEGGRSRTGRLLKPKAGMLAMTINSYIRNPRIPVVFIPVYFGYEKLIEGDSFISEMGGAKKQKESLFGLFRSIKSLREHFGKVYVNVGEPIRLNSLLDQHNPDWRLDENPGDERPQWLTGVIDELGNRIMSEINAAAAVTPISLLAYTLLSTPKQCMGELELRAQLNLSNRLLRRFKYSDLVTVPDWSADEIVDHGEKLKVIERTGHPLGGVVSMTETNAVLMTYFRNNIQHLFAIPASIACCFIQGRELAHAELQRLVRMIYPFMQKELNLQWNASDIDGVTTTAIEALIDENVLIREGDRLVRPPTGSAPAFQLMMLGQSMVPMLQRFYLVIALLVRNESGTLTRAKLEGLCQQSAQRLAMIYGLHSPDFFDKALFQDFIRTLREKNAVRRNEAGFLEFGDAISRIGEDARLVLGEEIRHSILSLTFSGPGFDRL